MVREAKRTCGSVRSSLVAPALLATEGLEAAMTTYLRLRMRWRPRGSLRDCQRQGGLRVRLGDKSKLIELPQAPRRYDEPKALTGSNQKVTQSVSPLHTWNTRTNKTAGVEAGTKSSMLLKRNTVNLTFRPLAGAGAVARPAVGMAGRGNWKKPRPSCNGADRSGHTTSPRKRADFQRVVHYETAGRTFTGGNSK